MITLITVSPSLDAAGVMVEEFLQPLQVLFHARGKMFPADVLRPLRVISLLRGSLGIRGGWHDSGEYYGVTRRTAEYLQNAVETQ